MIVGPLAPRTISSSPSSIADCNVHFSPKRQTGTRAAIDTAKERAGSSSKVSSKMNSFHWHIRNQGLSASDRSLPSTRLCQVERLFTSDPSTSAPALRALVSAGFLTPGPDGSYGRTDRLTSVPVDPPTGAPTQILRQALCPVLIVHPSGRTAVA